MTLQAAARRYAAALFEVVLKTGEIDHAERDLASVRALIDAHPELRLALETPGLPAARKHSLVDAVITAALDVSGPVRRLLLLLADRDRLVLFELVRTAFEEQVMKARGVVAGEVVSAVPLGDARREALARALGQASGGTVTLTEKVDPAIIGGLVARIGSVVYDGSVVHQIERMRTRLHGDV